MAYTYDPLARLSTAVTTGSTNYPKWGLQWTYDRYGSRTAQSVTAGTGPSNSVAVSATTNRIITTGYGYDANGNMTNDGLNTLTYDAENHAVTSSGGLGSGTYPYDGNGLRVKKVSGSTTTVYIFSGTKVIAEYVNGAAPGSPTREYIYSARGLLAKIEAGATQYYHPDHLSVRVMTDSGGNDIGEQGHYPFGESWYAKNTTTKWKFTSYERDSESGNDYARFRYTANRLGRFLTSDPVPPSQTKNPQAFNRYSYVSNDPINRIDRLGRLPEYCQVTAYSLLNNPDDLPYDWPPNIPSDFGAVDLEALYCGGGGVDFVPEPGGGSVDPCNLTPNIKYSGPTHFNCSIGTSGPYEGVASVYVGTEGNPPLADQSPVSWVVQEVGTVKVSHPTQTMNDPFVLHFFFGVTGRSKKLGIKFFVTWKCSGRPKQINLFERFTCVLPT